MRRQVKDAEVIFTDNFGNFVYSTLKIDWQKELNGYYGLFMNIAEEQAQWIAANTNIPGMGCEDVLQELRLHLLKSIPKYNPSKSSISGFVKFIVTNKNIDLKRKTDRDKRKALNSFAQFNEE